MRMQDIIDQSTHAKNQILRKPQSNNRYNYQYGSKKHKSVNVNEYQPKLSTVKSIEPLDENNTSFQPQLLSDESDGQIQRRNSKYSRANSDGKSNIESRLRSTSLQQPSSQKYSFGSRRNIEGKRKSKLRKMFSWSNSKK